MEIRPQFGATLVIDDKIKSDALLDAIASTKPRLERLVSDLGTAQDVVTIQQTGSKATDVAVTVTRPVNLNYRSGNAFGFMHQLMQRLPGYFPAQ